MSIRARDAVLTYIGDDGPGATLSPGQKLVLIDLADVGDDHGVNFLSERVQAERLGMARSSIQAARAALSDRGPLRVAEEVPGRAPMLWIELPGLDGDTDESWRRRRDRRPRGGPATGPPRHEDGEPGGPVDERGGGPVTGQGGPAAGPGVARLTRHDPLVDPLVDPLADPVEADRSLSNQDGNNNYNTASKEHQELRGQEALVNALANHPSERQALEHALRDARALAETASPPFKEIAARAVRDLEAKLAEESQ
jgi:hypothetical protein